MSGKTALKSSNPWNDFFQGLETRMPVSSNVWKTDLCRLTSDLRVFQPSENVFTFFIQYSSFDIPAASPSGRFPPSTCGQGTPLPGAARALRAPVISCYEQGVEST